MKKMILVLFTLVFVGSGGFLLYDNLSAQKEQGDIDRLVQLVNMPIAQGERIQGQQTTSHNDGYAMQVAVELLTPTNQRILADSQNEMIQALNDLNTPVPIQREAAQDKKITSDTQVRDQSVTSDTTTESIIQDDIITQQALSIQSTAHDEIVTQSEKDIQNGFIFDSQLYQRETAHISPAQDAVGESATQNNQDQNGIDFDSQLVQLIRLYILEDQAFANPAIEMLRIRIQGASAGEYPSVKISAMGKFLHTEPDTFELEQHVASWLQAHGWQSIQTQVIDLRVHIQMTILPKYRELYNQNQDLIGWIRIEDTKINYPVMYTPNDPELYLHKNFERKYAYGGLPFLDGRNEAFSKTENLIIYGHNMKNGTMFGQIPQYANKSYWEKHPIVQFDLLTEQREYEVVGAFRSHQFREDEAGFRYYDYIDLTDQYSFDEYIRCVKQASIYNTGITPQWGDQLLTLSTCSYHTDSGTFVVVCRRVK